MKLEIIKNNNYLRPVSTKEIHGKFPYKIYLEIRGNTKIGRHIVIVSNNQLQFKEDIDSIVVQLVDELGHREKVKQSQQSNKPNILGDGYMLAYKVKEVDVLKVGDEKVEVYIPLSEYKAVRKKRKIAEKERIKQERQEQAISKITGSIDKIQNRIKGEQSNSDRTDKE
jgi:hypothetical protein